MSENTIVRVADTMTSKPRSIDGLAKASEAIAIMRQENVSSLIIEKRHEGDEHGLVVVHDIAEKVIGADKAPDRVSVYEIMSKPVVSVDAEMDIKYAIRLLTRFGLSRALVIQKGEVVGVVTLRDMVFRFTGAE